MSAAGAAGALAGWAFSSVSRKLTTTELSTSIEDKPLSQGLHGSSIGSNSSPHLAPSRPDPSRTNSAPVPKAFSYGEANQALENGNQDQRPNVTWGDGDLMDVEADVDDWSTFETGPPAHDPSFVPLPSKIANRPKVVKTGGTNERLKLNRPSNPRVQKLTNAASLVAALEADQELDDGAGDSWGVEDFREDVVGDSFNDTIKSSVSQQPPGITKTPSKTSPEDEWGQFHDKGTASASSKASEAKAVSSKDDKAAQMAKMREDRRAKMAALKAKKTVGT